MAYIFPNSPVGVLPPEVLRAFRFFKSLPDDYVIWHHLAPWVKEAPDFLILAPSRHALLVKVCGAMQTDAHPAAQMLLLDSQRPPIGEAEDAVLDGFQQIAVQAGIPAGNISTLVLFPNIPEKLLQQTRPPGHPTYPLWYGQEMLHISQLPAWQQAFGGNCLDPIVLERLRASFAPEVVVPSTLTVRTPNPRRIEAGLTDYLLDYNQEAALKADLDLPQEGQSIYKDFRLSVINGVTGSGKTLILLYRLRLLHGLYPNKRFLVLTHNRPLIRDLKARYKRLSCGLPSNITWETFNSWCRHNWPVSPAWADPLREKSRYQLIEEIWRVYFSGTAITPGMLRSEIDWYKDQVMLRPKEYLQAERRGRGFRLSPEQRDRMAKAIMRYEKTLESRHCLDWGDIPRRMWGFLQNKVITPPIYDVILVDEAQFFAPLWFDVIRRLVRSHSGHLFIVADPTQGFLRRGGSWKSLGLDVRGHTHRLERSYRTTQEILNFAALFYRQRLPAEDPDDEILAPDLINLPGGAFPQLIPMSSSQDEIARVANEIEVFARQGLPLGHILVLHALGRGVNALIAAIQKRLGQAAAADPKNRLPGDYVRVTTLNAGTGLESPIVFLVGINRMFEEEQSLRLSDQEREELIRDNTRKLYMATTRAGQRLVITYVGRLPDGLKKLLTPIKVS